MKRAWILCLVAMLMSACDGSSTEPCPGPLDSDDLSPPIRLFAPAPEYTEEARQARIQGVVILQLVIDCEGLVTSAVVTKGLPLGLSEAAVDAVQRWRFEPARQNGVAVSVVFNVTVNFSLQ